MIVEQLKKSILQMATEGKLVAQSQNQSAKKELSNILEEPKDNKKYQYSEVKEIPFEIPKNWVWVKLEDICLKITDGAHKTPKYTVDGIPFLSVKDISNGKINFNNTKYISKEEHQKLYKRCNPEYKDILITKIGTTGIPVIVNTNKEFSLFVSVALLKFNTNKIFNKFLVYFLNSPIVQKQVKENTRGIGNKNWVLDAIKTTILPLPPLEEQQRIVEKLDKLFTKLDELKIIETELMNLSSTFGQTMKESILFYYLTGLKTNNSISLDRYNEIILPLNWKWEKFSNLTTCRMGKTILSQNLISEGIPVYSATNTDTIFGYVKDIDLILNKGDLVIPARGNSIGCATIINDGIATCTQTTIACYPNNKINSKFLYYCCYAFKKIWFKYSGSAIPQITISNINNNFVPLPPLEEQQRIVDKIEKLLPLCNDIEKLIERL